MSGRGIVEAEVFRSELIEANARTSDPTNPAVGDFWIRSDVQPSVSGATTVAALRIQGPGGVLEVPLFDSSEASNLGADVYVGERRIFDDGTVGFIAETDQGGSLGSPRLLAPDGTEYEAHDGLEVNAIPDSGILHEWPISDTTTPIPDAEGDADISLTGSTFDNTTDSWWDSYAILFDGNDDYGVVDSNRTDPANSGTLILTVNWQTLSKGYAFAHPGTNNDNRLYIGYDISGNGNIEGWVGADSLDIVTNPSTGTTQRLGITWDTGNFEVWLNGNSQSSGTYGSIGSLLTENWYFGGLNGSIRFGNVIVDFPRISTNVFTSQQMTDDYNAQPWS